MRILLQRVKEARVTVEGQVTGQIEQGLLLFVGVGQGDTEQEAIFCAKKCADLRIFSDGQGKMNLSAAELGLAALAVSQFTLYGDTKKGRRPSFIQAAQPDHGQKLYERFVEELGRLLPQVATGRFAADMQVSLVNDGPVTLWIEKEAEQK